MCYLNSQATVQKAGQEARWLQGFRASMFCEKQRSTDSSESLDLVLLMGQHVPGIGLNQVYEANSVPQYDEVRDAMRDLAADRA